MPVALYYDGRKNVKYGLTLTLAHRMNGMNRGAQAMKDPITKALVFVAVFLLGFVVISAVGSVFGWEPFSVFSAGQPDKYEIRSRLLMDATDEVGACSPEQAARVWADGLKGRSAALQYAVMTKALKTEYAMQLEKTFPNWVTGMSSPWVDSYEIVKADQTDADTWKVVILFHLKTSTGPAGDYFAYLDVIKDGGYWRIIKVATDRELSAYTGFVP